MSEKVKWVGHQVTNNMQLNKENAHLAAEGHRTGHHCSSIDMAKVPVKSERRTRHGRVNKENIGVL